MKVYVPPQSIKKIYPSGSLTPPKFYTSLIEWLWLRGKYIHKAKEAVSTTQDVYEVPENYVFFLTNISVVMYTQAGGGAGTTEITLDYNTTLALLKTAGAGRENTLTQSYNFPLKIKEKSKIRIETGSDDVGFVVIDGFLVENSEIPTS